MIPLASLTIINGKACHASNDGRTGVHQRVYKENSPNFVLTGFSEAVGVAVLEEPVKMATYGALPDTGLVDTLEEGQRLTTVGYGATGFHLGGEPPPRPVYTDDRYRAMVRLLTTNNAVGDQLLKTSGIGIVGGGEGSCFGDSGGPLFMPDQETIVGVTSFGTAPRCRGPAYNQRMDIPQVLKWVRSFP